MIYRASFRSQNDSFSLRSEQQPKWICDLASSRIWRRRRLLWPTFKLFLRPLYIAVHTEATKKTWSLKKCHASCLGTYTLWWNNIYFVWKVIFAVTTNIARFARKILKCEFLPSDLSFASLCNFKSSAKMSKLPANYTARVPLEDNKIAQNWMSTLHA